MTRIGRPPTGRTTLPIAFRVPEWHRIAYRDLAADARAALIEEWKAALERAVTDGKRK